VVISDKEFLLERHSEDF
jgi:hypothetical protein